MVDTSAQSPPPWSWSRSYNDDEHWELKDAKGGEVLSDWGADGDSGLCVDKPDRDLIAAAPDLLEALRGLRRGSGGCWCDMAIDNPMVRTHSGRCETASAATAKAEGR